MAADLLVNLPAGVVALLLLARVMRSPRHSVPFDWAGQVAVVAAMGGLTYGAVEAGSAGITAPSVLAALAVAVVGLIVFLVLQSRGRHPMLPLSLFRSRTVSVAVATGFAFMVGYYGLPFVMSLYLQELRGLSALETGVVFLPMMLIGAALTPFTARLSGRFGARTLIFTGPLVMPPVTALLLQAVPARRAGVASGVFNTSRQVGGALAVALFGALLSSRATFVHGLRVSLLIAAAVALVTVAVSLLLRPADASTAN